MDQSISQGNDLSPGNFRVGRTVSNGYAAGCLADDLQKLKHGQYNHSLLIEILATFALYEAKSLAGVRKHLPD